MTCLLIRAIPTRWRVRVAPEKVPARDRRAPACPVRCPDSCDGVSRPTLFVFVGLEVASLLRDDFALLAPDKEKGNRAPGSDLLTRQV